jgi:hypothetical protein
MKEKTRLWIARSLIGLVTFWNLQAALVFMMQPHRYAARFELSGEPGAAAVRGTGILFLMWSVPYLVSLWHPYKYRLILGLALTMQFIGLVGESMILVTLSEEHNLLRSSITRFVAFDASGLILLVVAFWSMSQDTGRKRDS